MKFDRVAILDWSAAGSPKTGKDSIWLGIAGSEGVTAENIPTRLAAEARLIQLAREALERQERLLIGADFNFGAPAGFIEKLTGSKDGLALWRWLATRVIDTPQNKTNYRSVAAQANTLCGDNNGPFWGNGEKVETPGLPRTKPKATTFSEHRVCDVQWKGERLNPKTIWQLAGAGAVGAQGLTGIPMLQRLRESLGTNGAVWPFEPADAPVVIAEIYTAPIDPDARVLSAQGMIHDEAQVRVMATALLELGKADRLAPLFAPDVSDNVLAEEGWTLGAGIGDALRAALPATQTPPRLRDDCFAMPQGTSWVPVDAALARLHDALRPVTGVEDLPIGAAQARILAQDAIAQRSNPPRANSAVDGYGFAHASTGDGVQRLPLVDGRAAAGQPFDAAVPAGHAVRILTGAILPDGVDSVVMEEDCQIDSASVTFDGPVKPRANARRAGEDVVAGELALPKGHKLRAPDIALLSALGIGTVQVHRRLRVGVLSTGDEILPKPSPDPKPHQIFDANRPMLLGLAANWAYDAVDLGHVRDDPDMIRKRLTKSAQSVDIILTSGGASAGDEDHVSRLLSDEGQLSSWRIAMKPGRPLALAMWQGTPVIGLPGNPVAALVCALIFARPALSLLAGGPWLAAPAFTVPAAFAKSKKAGRREYLRARINADGAAKVFASEGSGRISGLAWADGLVELPDEAADITPSTPVKFMPYSGFGLS